MASNGQSKSARSFGEFAPANTASSLFDAAFSKPVPRKRFSKTTLTSTIQPPVDDPTLPSVSSDPILDSQSPKQVFSPPVSLPESNSTDGAMDRENNIDSSDNEEDVDEHDKFSLRDESQSSTGSIDRKLKSTAIESPDNSGTEKSGRTATRTFDFDDDSEDGAPSNKKLKQEIDTKFIPLKERRPVYQHRWTEDNDDGDDDESKPSGSASDSFPAYRQLSTIAPSSQMKSIISRGPIYSRGAGTSRVRNVKEAHQCLESGEHDDFKQDLEYTLSTLRGESSRNVKCLSAVSLARKCISPEFRQFIRSEGQVNHVFKSMMESPCDKSFALCAATVIYLMSRDFISMNVDSQSLRLLTQLLRIESMDDDAEQMKYRSKIWKVFEDYLVKMETAGKKILFEIDQDNLTPSSLVLEALVYVLTRANDDTLKTELLNLGVLQWIVAKVERISLRFQHDKLDQQRTQQELLLLERCFRILESSTFLHKKNQAFLISHRGSVLVQTCGKLFSVIHTSVAAADPQADTTEELVKSYMGCLSRIARVLMNMSHENELCSTKLGQMPGFLNLCVTTLTFLIPRYAATDKKFDMYVMIASLLVNLVERCNSNRRKVIEAIVTTFSEEVGLSEDKGLDALTKIFCYHEAKARTIDEDLDKDLAFEEPVDDENDTGGGDSDGDEESNGKLDREKIDISEGEMLNIVQKAMSKAKSHMEDSVIASYIALLMGCLLQQNEECAAIVRTSLPTGDLSSMIEQLQRFLEFMKIASQSSKNNGHRSIERIIDLLERIG